MLAAAGVLRAVELHIGQRRQRLRVGVRQRRGFARRLLGLVQLAGGDQRIGIVGLRRRIVRPHVGHFLLRLGCAGPVALFNGDGGQRGPDRGGLGIEPRRLEQVRLAFLRLVPEKKGRRADIDVRAPVARRQLEQLQFQRARLLRFAVLVGGVDGQLGPLRLGQRCAGLRGGVHFLHRFHAGGDGVEQRLCEQQLGIEGERLAGGRPRQIGVPGDELIVGFDVGGGGLRRSGGDADGAALRRSGEKRKGAERRERCHGSPPSGDEHRYAAGIPRFRLPAAESGPPAASACYDALLSRR